MFKQYFGIVAVAASILMSCDQACCHDVLSTRTTLALSSDAKRRAADLLDEIVTWLSSNYDLPAIKDHPKIELAANARLATMRAFDSAASQSQAGDVIFNGPNQRRVVALYDSKLKTILLPEDWTGNSPADQSVLVHEMVHHLQNLSGIQFDCPSAREKMAYLAQAKWLERSGLSLEREFDVDMFTIVISSACFH